jgi:hypothetical protein
MSAASIAAWILLVSWTECGSGWSCGGLETAVPGIATEADCKALGQQLVATKRDRPSFKCFTYQAVKP